MVYLDIDNSKIVDIWDEYITQQNSQAEEILTQLIEKGRLVFIRGKISSISDRENFQPTRVVLGAPESAPLRARNLASFNNVFREAAKDKNVVVIVYDKKDEKILLVETIFDLETLVRKSEQPPQTRFLTFCCEDPTPGGVFYDP